MSLQHFLYGDKNPTPVHQIMTGIIVVSFLLSVYGLLAEFVPEHGWTQGGGFFAVSLLAILVIGAKAIEGSDRNQRFYVSSSSTLETIVAGGIRSVFYLSVLWLAFVHGFAALFTGLFGQPYLEQMEVSKQRASNSVSCEYQVTGPQLQSGATQYICISLEQFVRWPQDITVKVEGRRSVLGKTVTRLERAGHA